jgi:hypothetical protein
MTQDALAAAAGVSTDLIRKLGPGQRHMRALRYVPRRGSQPLQAVIGRTRPALPRRIAVVQRTAALSPAAAAFLDVLARRGATMRRDPINWVVR